jgi:hypothetical protein
MRLLMFLFMLLCGGQMRLAAQSQVRSDGDGATQALPEKPKDDGGNKTNGATRLGRWFELQTASLRMRYLVRETSAGIVDANTLQHQENFQGRFKFDAAGNYSLTAGIASGNGFTSGWSNTGWGAGKATARVYLKHLFLSAKPVEGLELQYGGFDVLRGQGTEITTFDNDGFVTGQRLFLRRPKKFFFDEIAVTYGYFGDLGQSNLNKRFHRLKQSNYHQFQVTKKLGSRATVSGDYSFVAGVEYLHQAIKLKVGEARLVDTLNVETYERLDVDPAFGFNVHGEKALSKRLTVGAGVKQVDRRYPLLNADRFFQGRHAFFTTNYVLTPELSIGTFYAHSFATDYPIPIRQRFEVLLTHNLLKSLQKLGLFK